MAKKIDFVPFLPEYRPLGEEKALKIAREPHRLADVSEEHVVRVSMLYDEVINEIADRVAAKVLAQLPGRWPDG